MVVGRQASKGSIFDSDIKLETDIMPTTMLAHTHTHQSKDTKRSQLSKSTDNAVRNNHGNELIWFHSVVSTLGLFQHCHWPLAGRGAPPKTAALL